MIQFDLTSFDCGKKDEIVAFSGIRMINGISSTSAVEILAVEADLYVAKFDGKLMVKIGPKNDLGSPIL